MRNRQKQITRLVHGALIAAVYAAATYALSAISYGPVQFRISEALTVFSVFTPAAVPGLAVGCALGNLTSPYGIWDIVLGSFATLLAAIFARLTRNITFKSIPVLSVVMPVIFNALIIGAEITLFMPESSASFAAFAITALQIAAGELTVCLLGGIPLFLAVKKSGIFKNEK